jgi:hypothetical protein
MKFAEKVLFFFSGGNEIGPIRTIEAIESIGSMRYPRQLPDLAGSFDDVFVAGQLLQTHRAAGM